MVVAVIGFLVAISVSVMTGVTEQAEEEAMLQRLAKDARWSSAFSAWNTIAEVQKRNAELLGMSGSFSRDSHLYSIAESLVLMAQEDRKPSEERLREFRDSARESFEQELFSPAPIYDDFERVKLADGLAYFIEKRGGDDPLSLLVLGGKGPRERAAELINGCRLEKIEVRKSLAEGGQTAIDASVDPMILFAKSMVEEYRRLREIRPDGGRRQHGQPRS